MKRENKLSEGHLEVLVMNALDELPNHILINSSKESIREYLAEQLFSQVFDTDTTLSEIYQAINNIIGG